MDKIKKTLELARVTKDLKTIKAAKAFAEIAKLYIVETVDFKNNMLGVHVLPFILCEGEDPRYWYVEISLTPEEELTPEPLNVFHQTWDKIRNFIDELYGHFKTMGMHYEDSDY